MDATQPAAQPSTIPYDGHSEETFWVLRRIADSGPAAYYVSRERDDVRVSAATRFTLEGAVGMLCRDEAMEEQYEEVEFAYAPAVEPEPVRDHYGY